MVQLYRKFPREDKCRENLIIFRGNHLFKTTWLFFDPSAQSDPHSQYGGLKMVLVEEERRYFASLQSMATLLITLTVTSQKWGHRNSSV